MRIIGLIAVFALFLTQTAIADSISIYPPEVQLDHTRDHQRFVVVYKRDDGVTIDVTDKATINLEPATLAARNEQGLWVPKADGEGTIAVSYEGHSAQVPFLAKNAAVDPPISFRNDVEAAIMRAGCNTGACHGSAQGKNGFRMSLFGYDPPHDYTTLTRDSRGRRLNAASPLRSLMLGKPLGKVDHEGGQVIDEKSPLYEILRRWIAEGAKDDVADLPKVTGIDILPEEAVMEGEGARQQYVVLAHYSNGTDRDVTELAVLSSVDESIVAIDDFGLAKSGKSGEAYIMARFNTFAVVANVISIAQGSKPTAQPLPPANFIDEHMHEKFKKLRITQAQPASDEVFVRRVYLDILGVLPTVEETCSFLADQAPDKRAKLIDVLLERPELAEVWAMKWAEVLRVRTANTLQAKGMHRYNDWLRLAIQQNKPMDQLARDLLSAEGGSFSSPQSNFYLVEQTPTLMAENVAQVFMGIRMQCAQCHNHPFERWTMDDYYSFSAFFSQIGIKGSSDPREMIVYNSRSGEQKNLRDGQVMKPKFLGGATPDLKGRDRRVVLAEWLTSKENPYFSKNLANRIWEHFMGKGIIHPTDDVRVTNPPSNPQLLQVLGERLASYDFDMRQLIRDICNSNTYQASTQPAENAKDDTRNFAYAIVRRLPSEVLLDAISQVTDTKVKFSSLPLGSRAIQVANGPSGNYFLDVFGRPSRLSASTEERRNEPTLAQVLHLINGDTFTNAIASGSNRLNQQLAAEANNEAIIDDLYIAAFSRNPQPEEMEKLLAYIAETPDRKVALEDVYWSVLNSKEFIFTH
ncbi:MAG: DUF1549 and DUF1553 domain-containing protein [Candidatus Hydrogenedentota bacterium]